MQYFTSKIAIYQYSTKIFAYCFQAPLKQYTNVWTNRYCKRWFPKIHYSIFCETNLHQMFCNFWYLFLLILKETFNTVTVILWRLEIISLSKVTAFWMLCGRFLECKFIHNELRQFFKQVGLIDNNFYKNH